MEYQYSQCNCESCQRERLKLTKKEENNDFKKLLKTFETAFKTLFERKGYKPEDLLKVPEFKKVVEETAQVFSSAIPHETPSEMKAYLEKDAFIFSGLKTHAQLTEARSYLKDDNGHIVPFSKFQEKVLKLNERYNQHYLEAEYQFAVHSAQSAANWANLQEDTSRYWLEYRTAGDEKVRAQHQALNGICLPKDDDFWTEYYPPNGWRCRCIAVEVLAREKNLSDSKKAQELGEKATTQIGTNGKNKLQMFRFNPGKEQKIFPPNNAYEKVVGAKEVKKEIDKNQNIFKIEEELKNVKDLSNVFNDFSKAYPEYFVRGFNEIKITRQRGVNGFTDMNGNIALTSSITELCISGLNHIRLGKPTTFEQEKALSTLHHEIWHNANKVGNIRMTAEQTKVMELANEYVSRKTLGEFLEKLGGKLQNEELTKNRTNTGYNTMVVNYDKLVKWIGSDDKKVINSVKTTLVENSYLQQKQGLVKAILDTTNYQISNNVISTLIDYAQKYDNSTFEKLLEKNNGLRK